MKLLKNQQEFEELELRYCRYIVPIPNELPCYALIDDYGGSIEYYYAKDLQEMLISLLPPNATVKISTP